MHENGPGSSPILYRDLVIFHADGSDKQFIAALDKQTGKLAWKTKRSGALRNHLQLKKAYGTPILLEEDGQLQLISPAADWLYSYDPGTGRELWKLSYGMLGFSIAPRPVAGHGMVYMSTCFTRPQLLAIGLNHGSNASPAIQWKFRQGVPTISSPLLVGDNLYYVSDSGGIVTCLDAHSGQDHWRERIGGNHAASPLFADGNIYFCSREGETSILRPGKTFQVLSRNNLDGSIMASPAAVDQALYVRTDQALYRIEKTSP
jgi:outer membrane protein assembly factor BamB